MTINLWFPLIISNPAQTYPVKVVSHQVRLMDVMPTVAEILDVPIPYTINGKSLLPLMKGKEQTGRMAYGAVIQGRPQADFPAASWLQVYYGSRPSNKQQLHSSGTATASTSVL